MTASELDQVEALAERVLHGERSASEWAADASLLAVTVRAHLPALKLLVALRERVKAWQEPRKGEASQ